MNQILLGIFCIYKPIGSEILIYDLLLPWNHQLCAGVNNFILPLYFPIRALKTIYNRFRMIDKTFRASIARTKLDFIESSERLRSSKPPTLVTFGMDFIFQDKIFLSNYILVLRRTRRRYRRVIKYLSSTCITIRREAISQISFVLHEHLCSRGGLKERKKEKKKEGENYAKMKRRILAFLHIHFHRNQNITTRRPSSPIAPTATTKFSSANIFAKQSYFILAKTTPHHGHGGFHRRRPQQRRGAIEA